MSKDITAMKEAEAELEELHRQLLQTSRQAGMAEVATSVLHNVGNVLNSVNVSRHSFAGQRQEIQCRLPGQGRRRCSRNTRADLGAFLANDPKGKQLPGYLPRSPSNWPRNSSAPSGTGTLRENIEHIKEIVAMQQSYAKVSGVVEIGQSDRAGGGRPAHERRGAGPARRDVGARISPKRPPISVEKHKVLQILVNLIRNAKYACDESGRHGQANHARIASGSSGLCIAVMDNGVGIPPENLHPDFQPRIHDPQGRPRLRPAQRRAGGQGNGRHIDRPQRGLGPRSHLYPRIACASS